ncbi:hypothetical protein BDD14_6543 [Edaphobacter modestus]|uniref:Uncharacterized protein n=1 Tax=Edaphobacter modestus TaxID=388466 RepID=A0A4Q7XX62_9BACT|nr:hypothetical protein BDD14_6543 [Edaphobacter modestus]
MWPKTFGEFVTMLLKGLGIKTYITVGEAKSNTPWRLIDDHHHHAHQVDDTLVQLIDSCIDKTYFPEERQKEAS